MTGRVPGVPRTIWFLWFQGLENAPQVVRACHQSWVTRNPDWQVVSLDEHTIERYGSADYRGGRLADLSQNHRSDLLRLDLLARHGGVWADSTTFCVQPLDTWLPVRLGSGFFAFDRPGPDRLLSSWFLAAEPENILVTRLFERMSGYWGEHSFRKGGRQIPAKVVTRLLQRSARTRSAWFSPVLRDWLALSPYYAFHYGFEKLVREDAECARVWAQTPKVSADGPHRLLRSGLLAPVSPELRTDIDQCASPVYKTTWKLPAADIPAGSTLGYLLGTAAV